MKILFNASLFIYSKCLFLERHSYFHLSFVPLKKFTINHQGNDIRFVFVIKHHHLSLKFFLLFTFARSVLLLSSLFTLFEIKDTPKKLFVCQYICISLVFFFTRILVWHGMMAGKGVFIVFYQNCKKARLRLHQPSLQRRCLYTQRWSIGRKNRNEIQNITSLPKQFTQISTYDWCYITKKKFAMYEPHYFHIKRREKASRYLDESSLYFISSYVHVVQGK